MNKIASKLALGSANFGLDYGLANHSGKVPDFELKKILRVSEQAGIKFIDIAQAYGDSERRIGALSNNTSFDIITKIGIDLKLPFEAQNISTLISQSCQRLKRPHLYAVMLHRPELLLGHQGRTIIKELLILKEKNIVSKIGVSIYSPEALTEIVRVLPLDIVQAPFNIFDQRILSSGWSQKLKSAGVEIHTRSVFLQGLLLMRHSKLPNYFTNGWPNLFSSWYNFLSNHNMDALNVALKFALTQDWVDKVVVGVDNAEQLKTLLSVEKSSISLTYPQLRCFDSDLIDPSQWELS